MRNLLRISFLYLLLPLFSCIMQCMESSLQSQTLAYLKNIASHEKNFKGEGFVAGTHVLTTTGLKPIQDIAIGQEVLSYDRFTDTYRKSVVVRKYQKKWQNFIRLSIGNETIESNGDQRFLDEKKQWRYVRELQPGVRLLTHDMHMLPVTRIERIQEAKIFYALALQGPRNFAIGYQKLLSHNIEPITMLSVGSLLISAASGIFNIIVHRKARKISEQELKEIIESYRKNGISEELRDATVDDVAHVDDAFYSLPRKMRDCVFAIIQKYRGKTTPLSSCTPEELGLLHTTGMLAAIPAKSYATISASDVAQGMSHAAQSGALSGAVNGVLNLGIDLVNGEVKTVGDAVVSLATPIATSAVKGAAIAGGKQGALAVGARVAPAATAKILPSIPYVSVVYNGYNIVTGMRDIGKNIYRMAKGRKALKGPSAIPQARGKNPDNNGPNNKGPGAVAAAAKVVNDNKEEVEFAYNKVGEIVGQTIYRGGEVVSQVGQVGEEIVSGVGRVTADKIRHFAEWRQQYSHLLRHKVDDCYEVLGKIPGLPDCVKFISQDRLHKGEIEVFANRTKHIGAWVADKALTALKWVKKADYTRKAFGK